LAESIDILKSELSGLVSSFSAELDEITRNRASQQRIDDYTSLLRKLLVKSSLCYLDDVLSFFDGRSYVPITVRRVCSMIGNLLHDNGVGASDIRKIGDMPFLVLEERRFPVDANKVVFDNCVLDVKSGGVLDFGTSIHTDYVRPYAYSEYARCPRWETFLNEVLPDVEEQMCLQEFFGMCYLDRERWSVEKFALFVGTGSNGKSVIFDVIKSVIGKDRVSYLSPDQLTNEKQVVSVVGKRLNFAPDIRKGAAFDSALKALSSGQDVAGWRLYAGSTVVKCPPLVFALNEMPRFRDVTQGFFRRILLFSFDITIPEERQDRGLASKIIENESGGVFRWIMEGLWRLQENRGEFTRCPKMMTNLENLKRKVRDEESPVLSYLDSIGYSISEVWMGQEATKMSASAIFQGMGGRLSMNAIARELSSFNVKRERGTEVRYYLYRK
jgi:P4 family phage/plasmid primase-like protien